MDVTVRSLRRGEIGSAARLLARAFAGDPVIGFVLAAPRRRRLVFPSFFRAALLELDELYAADVDGELVGVAAWAAPDPPASPGRRPARARVADAMVSLGFPRAGRRLRGLFAALGEEHPREPHWYLAFVGLAPEHQGRGLGAALLAPVLERADADGRLCYLETPFSGTRPFYRRLGFEQMAELRPIAGAPPVWTMARRPR